MTSPGGGRLGCAADYTVQLLFCPRDANNPQLWRRANLPGIRKITWSRRLSETAEGEVHLSTDALTDECCALLSEPDYWAFELRIWRDRQVVAEGPIWRVDYTTQREPMVIHYADVSDWFNSPYGLKNPINMAYSARQPVEQIAADIVRRVLLGLTPPDWPLILPYLSTIGTGRGITYKRGVVAEYLADTIADLGQYGMDWTTVGRRLIYMARATTTNRRVVAARLSDSDITDPITLIRDGRQLGTVGWGVRTDGNTVRQTSYGNARNYYGRHDRITTVSDPDADSADLLAAAKSAIAGRTGPQVALSMPPTATLKASAPITVDQLVCGQAVLVAVSDICRPVQARMQIVDVSATWVPGPDEQIQVGLTQLGQIDELDPTP